MELRRRRTLQWGVPDLLGVFSDLIRYETVLWNSLDARLRQECGIPLNRFETLQVLGRREPCRVNDIADELAVTWSGTSKVVDKLESAGLCRRRPNPDDGRSSLIELTEPGRRLVADGEDVLNDELAVRLQEVLSPTALRMLGDALGALRRDATGTSDVPETA